VIAIVMSLKWNTWADHAGFSLIEMVATTAVAMTVMAIAAPPLINMVDAYRLSMSLRTVERELQFARLTAVSTASPMRVRFNCPVAGEVRVVELIGTPSIPDPTQDPDTYLDRCKETIYPYKATGPDSNRVTKPNNDGPIRMFDASVTISASQTLEFWPDGTVHANLNNLNINPWPNVGTPGITLSMTRKGVTKNIVVNGFGKIQMDR
jgi:hypothetical protein